VFMFQALGNVAGAQTIKFSANFPAYQAPSVVFQGTYDLGLFTLKGKTAEGLLLPQTGSPVGAIGWTIPLDADTTSSGKLGMKMGPVGIAGVAKGTYAASIRITATSAGGSDVYIYAPYGIVTVGP